MFIGVPIGSFIGTPTFKERLDYLDKFAAYAPNRDGNGQIVSWSLAKISETNLAPCQDIACNAHLTPNFDEVRSPLGLDKITSFETSDNLTCQPVIDLWPDYKIFITVRASAGGRTYWFMVDGDAENEVLVPCTCVYLVPDVPPAEGTIV